MAAEQVERVKRNPRDSGLAESDLALVEYALRLTLSPAAVSERDVQALRERGLSDAAIHDATQVIAYFNYINRIADGLGVDLEPGMPRP